VKLRRAVPEAVRALAQGERRLGWALTSSGEALVATPSGLHSEGSVLPWTQVAHVTWQPPTLTLTEVAEVDGAGQVHHLLLEQDAGLAQVVRTQVTSSVAWSDVRRLQPKGKVRLVGRRQPERDDLLWQTVWLDGTDPDDPLLRTQAEALVADLRGTLG
jgi:hypothetical protein